MVCLVGLYLLYDCITFLMCMYALYDVDRGFVSVVWRADWFVSIEYWGHLWCHAFRYKRVCFSVTDNSKKVKFLDNDFKF